MNDEWSKHLRQYYNVDHETAERLGTRSTGRRPDLPGSATCEPVSGKTFEEIWAAQPRKTEADIFKFYRDHGAWCVFRQVVRHKDMSRLHINLMQRHLKDGMHMVEYGCGVAPFSATLLSMINPQVKLTISLTDVLSEHLTFGEWRLRQIIEERGLKNVTINVKPVLPDSLPRYDSKIDLAIIFEVMEHVPQPVAAINNIIDQLHTGGIIIENFIKHDHDDDNDNGCDLASARKQRNDYYKVLKERCHLYAGRDHEIEPNQTREWRVNVSSNSPFIKF